MNFYQGKNLWTGYFPIRIYLNDSGNVLVCITPEDIPVGQSFRVMECNVEPNALDYQI